MSRSEPTAKPGQPSGVPVTNEELVRRTAAALGVPAREVRRFQDAFLGEIRRALKEGERVYLTRFGSLSVRPRPSTFKRHPQTRRLTTTAPDVWVKLHAFPDLRRYLLGDQVERTGPDHRRQTGLARHDGT